ncbi:MAPK kinase substrate protein At1g80180-like [Punica granatum]|uniref:Uncharacterized protein n=2 Tax=Punica granatum TaxID=22663 RepID=A0A218XQ97_PUNGR|nr:MAPK kinase substrate protein At1g80180-like [Punica granatum]OWM86691.1 hypothetical protein CDL15_Pgr015727 [Punica granatum]PKI47159.1 hypothetical protein CRG98_032451 [Punica granatum]
MATLQRSAVSFRRQGSSGPVWDDKYYLGEEGESIMELRLKELRPCKSTKAIRTTGMEFDDSNGPDAGLPQVCPRSLSVDSASRGKFSLGLPGVFGKKMKPGKDDQ